MVGKTSRVSVTIREGSPVQGDPWAPLLLSHLGPGTRPSQAPSCQGAPRRRAGAKVTAGWVAWPTHRGRPVAMQNRSMMSLELQYLLKTTCKTEAGRL